MQLFGLIVGNGLVYWDKKNEWQKIDSEGAKFRVFASREVYILIATYINELMVYLQVFG